VSETGQRKGGKGKNDTLYIKQNKSSSSVEKLHSDIPPMTGSQATHVVLCYVSA